MVKVVVSVGESLAIVAIPLAAVVQAFVVKYLERYRATRGWPGPGEPLVASEPAS